MPIKYKNELEMWHQFKEFAEELSMVSTFNEIRLAKACYSYGYDSGASEEHCSHIGIERTKDFNSLDECWKCPYYSEGKVKKKR